MCTVMLRWTPGSAWPLLVAAVRDEFHGRAWDPPGAHWPEHPTVRGGRDRVAGGTWMAVDTARPAVAALLNGVRRPPLEDGSARPTRGRLPLAALSAATIDPDAVPGTGDRLADFDGFHLLLASAERACVWSWDGAGLAFTELSAGDHILVNLGPDRDEDPLVPHFRPLLRNTPAPDPYRLPGMERPGESAPVRPNADLPGGDGPDLAGDGPDPADGGFDLAGDGRDLVGGGSGFAGDGPDPADGGSGPAHGGRDLAGGGSGLAGGGPDLGGGDHGGPGRVGAGGTETAWGGWVTLLRGDGLAPADPRGLIIEHDVSGRRYGSTSASLVAVAADGRVRYDFTATPMAPDWRRILPA